MREIPKVQQRALKNLSDQSLGGRERRSLLHEAASKGWSAVLEEGVFLAGENRRILLNRLLLSACRWGADHDAAVSVLLKSGADPNAEGVMQYCGVESLPILMDAGGQINANGEESPLITAIVERTKQDKALALIDAGANPSVADDNGVTALMHAAALGRNCRWALEKGPPVGACGPF